MGRKQFEATGPPHGDSPLVTIPGSRAPDNGLAVRYGKRVSLKRPSGTESEEKMKERWVLMDRNNNYLRVGPGYPIVFDSFEAAQERCERANSWRPKNNPYYVFPSHFVADKVIAAAVKGYEEGGSAARRKVNP